MARIVLAIDFEIEANWLEAIVRSGHEIVDRVIGSDALIAAVGQYRPDLAIVQASPETLTPRSLAACDRAGVRAIAVTGSAIERQVANTLGVMDRVDAAADWQRVEQVLATGAASGSRTRALDDLPVLDAELYEPPMRTSDTKTDAQPPFRTRRELRATERQHHGQDAPDVAESTVSVAGPPSSQQLTPQTSAPVPALAPGEPHRGRVIAIWGPYGAPGRSTVAINLAAACAERAKRVLLVDADSYGGAITTLLGLSDTAPGFAAACRLAGANSLDAHELWRLAVPAGRAAPFHVLGGVNNPARWPELRADRVAATLEQCRGIADVVIVDVGFNLETDEELASDFVGPRRNAATLATLEHSDTVIAVADATPVGVARYLRARLGLGECLSPATEVISVANRVRQGGSAGEPANQVREALRRFGGIESVHLLPYDERAIARSFALGLPVLEAAPRSRFARSIRALAQASALVQ